MESSRIGSSQALRLPARGNLGTFDAVSR